MAERRMMTKKVIHSDAFMDMPTSTQNLYFYLLLDADDDGFVNSPKRIQRTIGASDDDAKLLLAKNFIISFESGVIVIKHWKMHNYIQKDRYKSTTHIEEMSQLTVKDNNVYTMYTECEQNVRLGKDSIVEDSIGKNSRNKKDYLKHKIAEKIADAESLINQKAFDEWIEYKKYKTIAPISKVINFLSKYEFHIQQQIVDTSIMNQWQGLFEPKTNNFKKQELSSQSLNTSVNVFDVIEGKSNG